MKITSSSNSSGSKIGLNGNPSIKINGDKVIESDLEIKKFSKLKLSNKNNSSKNSHK